jgi:hypothetical protein
MQLNIKLYGTLTPLLLSFQLNFKLYVRMRLWNILYNIFQRRILTWDLKFSWMESKSGERASYSLILSCMGNYFTTLNLSSALFGQCTHIVNIVKKSFWTLISWMTQNGRSNYEAVTRSKQIRIPYFWKGYNKLQGYDCWKYENSQNSTHPSV